MSIVQVVVLVAAIVAGVALHIFGRRLERRMQSLEPRILRILASNPEGMFGRDVIRFLGTSMADVAVYEAIDRLVDKGMVCEREEPTEHGLSRTRHFITESGWLAIAEQ